MALNETYVFEQIVGARLDPASLCRAVNLVSSTAELDYEADETDSQQYSFWADQGHAFLHCTVDQHAINSHDQDDTDHRRDEA